jgi:DNA-directed RNA polymerase specialized sigma24 family protein
VRISGLYWKQIETALARRATILIKSISNEYVAPETNLCPFGENVKMVRQRKLNLKLLTPTEKTEVITKYNSGTNMTAVADLYGCHRTTVGRILRKRKSKI